MISIKYEKHQECCRQVKGGDLKPGDSFVGWWMRELPNETPQLYAVTNNTVICLGQTLLSHARQGSNWVIDRFVDLDITVKERRDR